MFQSQPPGPISSIHIMGLQRALLGGVVLLLIATSTIFALVMAFYTDRDEMPCVLLEM